MSLKVRANGSIKSQVKSKLFFTRKIDYPQPRAQYEPKTRTIKDPCIIQIRNKYTKELVDIEVRVVGLFGFVAYDSFLIRRPSSLFFVTECIHSCIYNKSFTEISLCYNDPEIII